MLPFNHKRLRASLLRMQLLWLHNASVVELVKNNNSWTRGVAHGLMLAIRELVKEETRMRGE